MAESDPKKEIEEPYELPEEWMWAALSEICKPKITKNPKNNGPGEFIYLDIESIDNEIQTIVNPRRLNNKKAPSRAKRLVNSGDVIISLVRPYLKNIALIPEDLDNSIASTAFYPLKPERGIDSHYLFHTVCRQSFIDSIVTYGDSPPSARDGEFIKIQIPLPPLSEQHRIVTKLEALLAQVNRSKDHLAKVPLLIKRFRQSVLAAACSGRLTEDWRREHPDVEPASELLNRIWEERIRRYDEECRKAEAKGRRKPKKPKNREPQALDTEGLPELPEGWVWVELGKSVPNPKTSIKCGPFGSQLKISEYVDSGIPVFGIDNVESNRFIWAKHKFISNEKYVPLSSFSVVPGDILITRTGTVGRTCIVPEGINKAIIGPNLLKVSLEKSLMLSRYISLYFNSEFIQREIERLSPGSTVAVFNTTNLKSLNVPLPPLAEQYIIIKRVETLFHFAEEVEQRVAKATAHTEHLTQSILARAFRGELVPQDPRDEPASVLLERIKQERAELKAKKKTQKRKSKTLLDFN